MYCCKTVQKVNDSTFLLLFLLNNGPVIQILNIEMVSWKNNIIMILCFILCFRRNYTNSSRSNGRKLVSKFYCEEKNGYMVDYNSFLWSIERPNSHPTYLYGTVHAPYDLVWRYVPMNAKDALMDATHVYTEVNLKDKKVIAAIRKCRQLPNKKTLKDVLPPDLFEKFIKNLKNFEHSRKRWIRKFTKTFSFHSYESQQQDLYQQYARLKPVWLINTILQQWNKFFVKSQFRPKPSLDSHIVSIAQEFGAYHGGIEDVSTHCDPMDRLSDERVHLALNITLHSQEMKASGQWQLKEGDIRRVVNLYKCGDPLKTSDLVTLFSDFIDKKLKKRLKEIDDYLSRELVYKRNIKMAHKIDEMLKDGRNDEARMFFAVGAAHLLGNNSIVSFLQKKGYVVKHIKPEENIPASLKRKRLEAEQNNIWQTTINRTGWVPNIRKEEEPKILIFNTQVKKTYVYYYNGMETRCSPSLTILMITLLSWLIIFKFS